MDNFMHLANIQYALFFNHKQHNLFEFGNAEYTNLNASMFQNLCPVRANVETPKQTARSQSPQLTITRASCYRLKTSDCSVTKKKNTVLQSSVWWQGRPHWSGLVNFKYPITVQTPFKVKSFKNSHPQTLQITYNWHRPIYWTCRSSRVSSLSAQKSRC